MLQGKLQGMAQLSLSSSDREIRKTISFTIERLAMAEAIQYCHHQLRHQGLFAEARQTWARAMAGPGAAQLVASLSPPREVVQSVWTVRAACHADAGESKDWRAAGCVAGHSWRFVGSRKPRAECYSPAARVGVADPQRSVDPAVRRPAPVRCTLSGPCRVHSMTVT